MIKYGNASEYEQEAPCCCWPINMIEKTLLHVFMSQSSARFPYCVPEPNPHDEC